MSKLFLLGLTIVALAYGQSNDIEQRTDENGQIWYGPIRKCQNGPDSGLDVCVKQIVQDLTSKVRSGIPEIGLQSLDPMIMEKFDIDFKMGPINVILKVKNIKLDGMTRFNKLEFAVDTQNNRTLRFEYEAPKANVQSYYKLGGNAFFYQLTGAGPADVVVSDIKAVGYLPFKRVERQNGDGTTTTIIQLDDATFDSITIGGLNLRAQGLFNGNPVFSAAVHYVANQYGPQVFEVIRGDLAKHIGRILSQEVINPVITKLPYLADYVPA